MRMKDQELAGQWRRDPRNPFRPSFLRDVLRHPDGHPNGLPRERLVALLAKATGKTVQRAGYDAEIVLSARPNDAGLNNNEGPRHRSCRPGFWIKRTNGHVS